MEPSAKAITKTLARADRFKQEGQFDRAITVYLKAIKLDLNNHLAYHAVGQCLVKQGKLTEAAGFFRHALEIAPDYVWSYHCLGQVYYWQGKISEAIDLARRATQLNPQIAALQHQLGLALAKQGDVVEAIAAYRRASELDNNAIEVYFSWAEALEKQKQFDRAGEIYQNILSRQPHNLTAITKQAAIYRRQGERERAIASYVKLIVQQTPQNNQIYLDFAELLLQTHSQPLGFYRQTTQSQPQTPGINLGIAKLCVAQGDLKAAINCYQQAINSQPNLPFWVYQSLARLLKLEKKDDEAVLVLRQVPQSPNAKIYHEIWQDLNQIKLPERDYFQSFPLEEVEQYFAQTSNYKTIRLASITSTERQFLQDANLNLAYLEANRAWLITAKGIEIAHNPEKSQDELADAGDLRTKFQQTLVDDGCIYAVCPSTGKILASNRSLPCGARGLALINCCYRFIGTEVFYLITGSLWSERCCLYFPRLELIIELYNLRTPEYPETETIDALKAYSVVNAKQLKTYLQQQQPSAKVVVVGDIDNIAHHLWNEISGIENLIATQSLSKIDRFLVVSSEFFGNLDELFPIPGEKIVRLKREEVAAGIFQNNYLAFRLGNLTIQQKSINRIEKLAAAKSPSQLHATIDTAKQCFPLLWITIRLGNRTWVNQIEGTTEIINALAGDFPQLGIVFDGFNTADNRGKSLTSEAEKAIIARETETVKEIQGLISPELPIYNTIGCSMWESVLWSRAIDLYLAPWGAGLTKVAAMANKPGVIHTNKTVLNLVFSKKYWWAIGNRHKADVPMFIPESAIFEVTDNVKRMGVWDRRTTLNNYNCDWQIMYQELLQLINNIPHRPQ
jgi:tetratricopeptide (TPR) repeat protein